MDADKPRPMALSGTSQATASTLIACRDSELASPDNADQDTELENSSDDAVSFVSEVRKELLFSSEKELTSALRESGIDIRTWAEKSAKSLRDLFWEILKRECRMQWSGGRLERHVKVLSLILHVDTFSGPKVLMERCQQIGSQKRDLSHTERYVMKKFYFGEDDDEDSLQAVALHNLCGLSIKTQQRGLKFMHRTERKEGPRSSFGYPGLMTYYVIIERHLQIIDPKDEGMQPLGLPPGLNFTHDEEAVPLWRRHFWTWKDDSAPGREEIGGTTVYDCPQHVKKAPDSPLIDPHVYLPTPARSQSFDMRPALSPVLDLRGQSSPPQHFEGVVGDDTPCPTRRENLWCGYC